MKTLAAILRLQGFEAVLSWIGELIFYPMLLGYFLLLTCAIFESCRFAHVPMCQNGARYVTYVAIRTLFRDILKMAKMCKWLKYNINRKRM